MRGATSIALQGAASGLVFSAFAVAVGLLVAWPAADVLMAGLTAFIGGAALEQLLRRQYTVSLIFIGSAAVLGFWMIKPVPAAQAVVSGAIAEVGNEGAVDGAVGARRAPAERKTERADGRDRRAGVAAPERGAAARPEARTTVEMHNPNSVPVSVLYQYPGGSLRLGTVQPGATGTFTIPSPGPLGLGTFTLSSGERTRREYAMLRTGRTHQVEIPSFGP